MTASNFSQCLEIILREEGGNDDDPRDHGGRTSRGITQREWDKYRKTHSGLPSDVWKAPQKDIHAIYRAGYWDPYCDDLPSGIDLLYFNAGVNSGPRQATKELQRALGVSVDGVMGEETLGAVSGYSDYASLVDKLSDQRRAFYRSLKQYNIYGKGWMARTDRVEDAAKDMVEEKPTVSLTKAMPEEESVTDQAVGFMDTAGTIVTKVKPLYKSRISGGAIALGASSAATVATAAPPTLWEQFIDVWKSPYWWLFIINISLVAFILYHYWRDHGRGAVK